MGLVWVLDQKRPFIVKDGLRLFEGDAVLSSIFCILWLVPVEAQSSLPHSERITTMHLRFKPPLKALQLTGHPGRGWIRRAAAGRFLVHSRAAGS